MVCIGVGSTLTAAVALAAPAAAALAVQAAAVATDAALGAVVGAADRLAGEGQQQLESEVTSRRWHMAAAEAAGVNAAIRLLTARARDAGVTLELPGPITLDGRSLDTVVSWLESAAPQLQRGRAELTRASVAAQRDRLVAALPITVDRQSIGEALRRYQDTLVRRGTRAAPAIPADVSWVEAEVHDALTELDPDAAVADREKALAAAALVSRQTSEIDASAFLDALQRLIRKEINPKVAACRLAARWSEAFEEKVVAAALAADPNLAVVGVANELAQVTAGEAELSPQLRDRARAALTWAADHTRAAYRADLLRTLLVQRGYQVEPTGATRSSVTRPDWGGEHTATVWLNQDESVHHMLVSAAETLGDDAAAREAARDEEVGRDVAEAIHEMSHEGVHGLVARAHEVQHGARRAVTASAQTHRARDLGPS